MNDNLLKNKTAVVTGAASGLGLAIARGLVDSGANVAVVDANEENLKNVYDRYFQGKKNIRICIYFWQQLTFFKHLIIFFCKELI